MANPAHIDPDTGIPDLVRRLSDDGKRLVTDEIRLAKLETRQSVVRAGRGGVRLAVAFGIGVVALVAFTVFLATLIGRVLNGHMWAGALITGILELVVALLVIKRGAGVLADPSYSLEQTRESLASLKRGGGVY
jgi:hypothetical protein